MTQNAADTAAELIAGRYQLERVIARGGMGVVYLAQQVMLNRPVALKVLSPPVDTDDGASFEERFRLEAETLASLDHRNIVTLYDYGQMPDGRFFLALEFIDGPRFTDLLRSGTLTVERTIKLLLQVCSALRYAHKRGVVHRDLKPSNLLIRLDDDGEECVKVVDFGLVKVMEQEHEITRAGLILGSPHCMAPEQIQSQAIDHRCDIYAMGVLLFRSLTGQWPFHADTGTATMVSHIKDPVPRFAEKAPGLELPAGLEAVVRKCLAKRADDRYPDVSALMRDLRAVLGLDPGSSTTATMSLGGLGLAITGDMDTQPSGMASSPTLLPPDREVPTQEPPREEAGGGRGLLLVALVLLLVFGGGGAMFMMYSLRKGAAPPPGGEAVEAQPVAPTEPEIKVVEEHLEAMPAGGDDEAEAGSAEAPGGSAEAVEGPRSKVGKTPRSTQPKAEPAGSAKEQKAANPDATAAGQGTAKPDAGSDGTDKAEGEGHGGYMGLPDDF